LRAGYELWQQSKISPLAGWPHEYVAHIVESVQAWHDFGEAAKARAAKEAQKGWQ
jgi:hypothetical protein